ncbi:C-type lectin domain family 4 member G-like [Amphiura filiformis]|uniref:C-type lectin domain family 4 member G-like n=1 Tax=Amphiura filiformis TaxID=82378 RepID=UPI003B20D6A8
MFSLPILVIFGLISTVSSNSNCCPDKWTGYKGSCYQYFALESAWEDAESYCFGYHKAHLVGINDKDENEFVSDLIACPQMPNGAYTWIGLNDMGNEGVFRQADGSSADFKNWASGEPNDSNGSENCVETNHGNRELWNDRSCTDESHFVCEKLAKKSDC